MCLTYVILPRFHATSARQGMAIKVFFKHQEEIFSRDSHMGLGLLRVLFMCGGTRVTALAFHVWNPTTRLSCAKKRLRGLGLTFLPFSSCVDPTRHPRAKKRRGTLVWITQYMTTYRYVDFTSLYPWCNKSTETVVGHPKIITENFDDISTYFGLIKCTVLPPKGLLHPVLPYRTKDKLMFPLCKTCADTLNQNPCTHSEQERAILGTWPHVELMKAIEKGYQVVKIHEVWHFPEHTDELFKDYVNTFLKIKQEASGYPKECVTDEQKQRYIDEYYEHEGIRLDPENIKYNPGLRSLAKLMLNSLWGMYMLFHNINPR